MAGNTKELRIRIKSVTSTLQLTKAMELVASSKIRKANDAMGKAREYISSMENAIDILTSDAESLKSPFMRKSETGKTKIIVIAGDRGLAGGYNANVFKLASEFPDAEIVAIGKRACEKYQQSIVSSEKYTFKEANELAETLCEEFKEGKIAKIGIIYTKYVSVMSSEATIKWLLPFEEGKSDGTSAVFEPDHVTVLNNLVKEYLAGSIVSYVRESFASEVSARRMAMDSAGKNAKQMIDDLQLEYNRARQGAITQEITEIVAGSGS